MFFDFFTLLGLIGLLMGVLLLSVGIKTWRTNTERSWLVRAFASFFIAFSMLILGGVAVFFISLW